MSTSLVVALLAVRIKGVSAGYYCVPDYSKGIFPNPGGPFCCEIDGPSGQHAFNSLADLCASQDGYLGRNGNVVKVSSHCETTTENNYQCCNGFEPGYSCDSAQNLGGAQSLGGAFAEQPPSNYVKITDQPTPAPTNSTPDGFVREYAVNCYSGHGAVAVDPVSQIDSGYSVEQCAEFCREDSACDCFVISSQGGYCWRRSQCDIRVCDPADGLYTTYFSRWPSTSMSLKATENGHPSVTATKPAPLLRGNAKPSLPSLPSGPYTTYLKNTDQPAPVPSNYVKITDQPTPAPTNSMPDGFVREYAVNCYSGHGAVAIDPVSQIDSGYSVEQCAEFCREDSACDCFVISSQGGNCWRRSQCDIRVCDPADGLYTTYFRRW